MMLQLRRSLHRSLFLIAKIETSPFVPMGQMVGSIHHNEYPKRSIGTFGANRYNHQFRKHLYHAFLRNAATIINNLFLPSIRPDGAQIQKSNLSSLSRRDTWWVEIIMHFQSRSIGTTGAKQISNSEHHPPRWGAKTFCIFNPQISTNGKYLHTTPHPACFRS